MVVSPRRGVRFIQRSRVALCCSAVTASGAAGQFQSGWMVPAEPRWALCRLPTPSHLCFKWKLKQNICFLLTFGDGEKSLPALDPKEGIERGVCRALALNLGVLAVRIRLLLSVVNAGSKTTDTKM